MKQSLNRNFKKMSVWILQQQISYRQDKEILWEYLDGTALTIAIIGAVNWGLIGLFRFDLVAFLFGDMSWFSRIVYVLVGISGLYLISFFLHLGDSEA